MKCPHCLTAYHDTPSWRWLGKDVDGTWGAVCQVCPTCQRINVTLVRGTPHFTGTSQNPLTFSAMSDLKLARLVYPKGSQRPPCPGEVQAQHPEIAADYSEACVVLPDSAKASAGLSRRCLQHLLQEKAGTTKRDLADQIQEVLDSNQLPSHLNENLDAIRSIGNFAAHPIKSTSSGEIVDVEPGEAEWNLDVLEQLFDFYYVQPAITARKRAALNEKLSDAGKPPIKS